MQAELAPIQTARLTLRPYGADDFDTAYGLWSDPRVFFWRATPYSHEEARAAFDRLLQLGRERALGGWAIERPEGGFLGEVRLQPALFDGSDGREIEIAYFMHVAAQDQGYASEAAAALLDYGFRRLALPRIAALALPTNARSLKLIGKLGMRRTGERLYTGLVHHYFALERETYLSRAAAP